MPIVAGSFVALITPMNADCSIDYMGFEDLMAFQRRNGAAALLIPKPGNNHTPSEAFWTG